MIILLFFAFLSGLVTIAAPCIWPLLPIILSSSIGGGKTKSFGIALGIMLSFALFTLSISYLVHSFGLDPNLIRLFAAIVLVIIGLTMIIPAVGRVLEGALSRISRKVITGKARSGFGGGFITGCSLGIVWTPCSGPILAAISTLAATTSLTSGTILVTLAYAIGIGIPLFLFSYGGGKLFAKMRGIGKFTGRIQQIFGIVLVLTAIAIMTNYDKVIQAAILDRFTSYSQFLTSFERSNTVKSELNKLKHPQPKTGSTVVQNVSLQSDFTGAKVKPEDLTQGCFRQDCIPSINNPKFETVSSASWMHDDDVIFTISRDGSNRAYPQRILNWHEIVNDTVAKDPIAVTFCPLCGSAVAFERKVNGRITEFGVSGKLYNSDLVMYDRYEGNLWQQVTGEAIVGPGARRNEKLKPILLGTTTWREWKNNHPNGQVLSLDTGFSRNYDQYPYGTYEQDDQLYFGVKNLNKQLPLKTVVYGIEVNSKAKAYPKSLFDKSQVITDMIGDIPVKLERTASGEIKVTNMQSGERIIPLRLFWFAWASFHPNTELYGQ